MSRTLFIWDIHGCYDELSDLYTKMQVSENDTVYATGDVINGWPKSFEVIQFLVANNVQAVMGNHEQNFFSYIADSNSEKIRKPLFDELLEKLRKDPILLAWLKSLPKYIENENFLLIHWGLKPGIEPEDQDINDITRLREHEWKPWHEFYTGNKTIIYGHWAQQGLRFTSNTRGLDSGCMWWWHLTGYCLETGEIWQVRANKKYSTPENWISDKK